MNPKNRSTNSHLGLGLIEVMISLGLLGLGGYVLMTSTGQWDKQERKSRDKNDINAIHLNLLKTVKGVLFDVKNETGKRTEGACKVIRPESEPRPPLGTIVTNPNDIQTVLTYERFEHILQDWQKNTSSTVCTNPDEFCFTPRPNTSIKNLRKEDVSLKIKVTTFNMNPTIGQVFRPLSSEQLRRTMDVKDLGFLFEVDLKIKNKRLRKKTFEWLGMLGHCDYKQNGEAYKLATSGMGVVKDRNTIYNRSSFTLSDKNPLDIKPMKIVAQQGQYDSNGRYIYTDASLNIATSCKEIKYQCPRKGSNTRTYSDMSVVANFLYRPNNNVKSGSSIRGSISYAVKRNGVLASPPIDTYFGFNNTDCSTRACTQSNPPSNCSTPEEREQFSTQCKVGSVQTVEFGQSANQISLGIVDQRSLKANNICRTICKKDNRYNTAGNPGKWQGSFNVAFHNSGGRSQELFVGEIGCTACYMKNCTQMGLGTFGPMDKMAYEPLDAGLPECSIQDSTLLDNLSPYKKEDWSDDTPKCIFAKLHQTENRLIFTQADCANNNKKSVLCFAFGQYRLAKDIDPDSGTSQLAKTSYANAANRCFQMGKEIVDQSKLDLYLGNSAQASTQGGNYHFNNIATQGIFLAPQSEEDIIYLKKWMINEQRISSDTTFWVALRTDGKKNILPRLPLLPSGIDQEGHALYFNERGRLTYQDFRPEKFRVPAGATSGDSYPVLFHNIKYKGVRLFKNDIIEAHYLCREKDHPWKIFLVEKKGKTIEKGQEICKTEGGLFLPPLTPYEWVYAMTLVEKIHAKHAFPKPDPKYSDWKGFGKAWVAASAQGNSQTGIDWNPYIPNLKLFESAPTKEYGVFRTSSTPQNTNDWKFDTRLTQATPQKNTICQEGTTTSIIKPTDTCGGTTQRIKKLCLNKNGTFTSRNIELHCHHGEQEIVHSDVKKSDKINILWELNKSHLPKNAYIAIKNQ